MLSSHQSIELTIFLPPVRRYQLLDVIFTSQYELSCVPSYSQIGNRPGSQPLASARDAVFPPDQPWGRANLKDGRSMGVAHCGCCGDIKCVSDNACMLTSAWLRVVTA